MTTKIEWVLNNDGTQGKTWNPAHGCSKASIGCQNCYAERMAKRQQAMGNYPNGFDVTLCPEKLYQPISWKDPTQVFVCSMGDLFHEDVPNSFIDRVMATMLLTPKHTYQLLTKRPHRMRDYFNDKTLYRRVLKVADSEVRTIYPHLTGIGIDDPSDRLPPWIWIGTTVETQKYVDRIDYLLQIRAHVKFLSCEPLLGPLNLDVGKEGRYAVFNRRKSIKRCMYGPAAMNWDQADSYIAPVGIDWVICGGETGHKARPMHPDWIRSIRDQCVAAEVLFFFKSWGEWAPRHLLTADQEFGCKAIRVPGGSANDGWQYKVGKKRSSRILDGKTWDQMPVRTDPYYIEMMKKQGELF